MSPSDPKQTSERFGNTETDNVHAVDVRSIKVPIYLPNLTGAVWDVDGGVMAGRNQ